MGDSHGDSQKPEMVSPDHDFATWEKELWPEPHPEWNIALPAFDWMWFAHTYGFGGLFGLTTLYSLFFLFWFRKMVFAKRKVHFVVTNLGLMFAGIGRSLGLLWDPYFSRDSSSPAQSLVTLVLWGTATAFITSAFSVMLLIVLETTKTSLGPPKMRNLPLLMAITSANIVYVVMSDTAVWFYPQARITIFVCHVVFSIWGFIISVGYLVAGLRIWRNLESSFHSGTGNDPCQVRDTKKLKRLFLFMSAASFFGLFTFSVSLYVSVGEFGIFAQGNYARHWPWFAIQTTMRVLELILTVLIFRIAFYNTKDCCPQDVKPEAWNVTAEFTLTLE